ncbi:MAG: electron transport complex subunit RsxC [Chromatiales bacterium]|nr:electron transport complex subunit RsxC [Chromatiales bacterium]
MAGDDRIAYDPQPRRPAWGVRVPRRKARSTQLPLLVAPPPPVVCISLAQGPGAPARPTVAAGQRVLCGEPIGEPAEAGLPRVHASISGRVTHVEPRLVAGLGVPVPCVVIRGAGDDERWPGYAPDPAADGRPSPELRDGIAAAGVLGLGGALFPTARKLATAAGTPVLLLNGAECEPYISCDDMLIRERADVVVAGARLLLAALGGLRCVIAVKTDMSEARVALYHAIQAAGDPRLVQSVVTGKYPAGGERQLIELVLGREVPAGGHPADAGVLCHNVATAAAVADFFQRGQPLISRIVTVTGGGVARPRNIEARIGTPVAELIALAGGYQDEPRRLIMGGPMMGVALATDELPMTGATNCLIAATGSDLDGTGVDHSGAEMPCIRCGDCVEACPASLLPLELLTAARTGNPGELTRLGVAECIECGACDYVCPSHIPLTRHFIAGKAALRRGHREDG